MVDGHVDYCQVSQDTHVAQKEGGRTELHDVANGAHDDEASADSGAHVEELLLIGC